MHPLFLGAIGGPELLIVLAIAVLLFGASKLPELARSSGLAMGEFRKGRESVEAKLRTATSDTDNEPTVEENAESA